MDTTTMNSTRKWASGSIAGVGLIHLLLAPEYFGEQAYVGMLFVLGALACAAVAYRLSRSSGDAAAWALGALVSTGMGVGFILSRTVGLPGFHESEWELSGILSLILEGAFIAMAVAALRSRAPEFARQET
jgi:drug/metabolite transporter (DMT)-like permease